MTKIVIYRNPDGLLHRYTLSGHADDKSSEGNDIYCAAISAIAQTAAYGIYQYIKADTLVMQSDGQMDVNVRGIPEDKLNEYQAIVETMLLGFKEFRKAYPEYLEIIEKRCK